MLEKSYDGTLTVDTLKNMEPGEIFAKGEAKILHPWFNDAKKTCDANGYATVRFVAVRGGGFYDWAIYHSLGFEKADYLDGTSHLAVDYGTIADMGEKLTNKNDVRKIIECDESAFGLYRF